MVLKNLVMESVFQWPQILIFEMTNQSTLNAQLVKWCHKLLDGKIAYLDYPPLWITVAITGSCAFKCKFCCSHNPASGSNPITSHQYKIPFNMRFEEFKKIVDLCHAAGVPHIHICAAGEPFFHPDILKFIDYLAAVYPEDVSLQTDFCKRIFEKKHFLDEIIIRKKQISWITTDIFPQPIHNQIKQGSDFKYLLHCMERLSNETEISFNAHIILNKYTYTGISELITLMHSRNIRFQVDIVNLFPLEFNEFTSITSIYVSSDLEITKELEKVREVAARLKVVVNFPKPWNEQNLKKKPCVMFWQKAQIVPSKKILKEKWSGNAIPQQCNAVVCGDLFSIGNILEHNEFMKFWNNDKLLAIRQRIVDGELPDRACLNCYTGCHGGFNTLNLTKKALSDCLSFLYKSAKYLNLT